MSGMIQRSPFRYFKTSPEIIRLAVMLCVRFPHSLRNVVDLLHKRGIEVSREAVRFRRHRLGPSSPPRSSGNVLRQCGPACNESSTLPRSS